MREYRLLIPAMDYKQSINEFKTADCVICMEEFKRGVMIRKVPTC